ncbi:Leucine-rich receptor-like protein kinase family protein [Thalictrum thalictroides]|uniref:Leucine-rich receptor-like protein kinase family protein n=1 Tax=Thalictrum thalictroides TaxID=46969 RepID=A0A7J6V1D8_THATH|nr:Leucine-rich receptor-like protein kinase family protein [Thalictrum thalictroides]
MGISSSEVPLQLNDDVLGLIVFKSDLQDPGSSLTSWNEDDDSPCSWKYIQCNPINNRVSQVSLNGLGLSGKIGRGLEKLQYLQILSLAHNNFTDSITPKLFLISSLRTVNLSHNSFSGRIPINPFNMTSIRFLDLSHNSLSGPIPDTLFQNCFSLRFLSLAYNSLEGPIPTTLSNCASLGSLNLSNNHLSGNPEFSNGIWLLRKLRILDLSNNHLSGEVSRGVFEVHNLKQLHLQGNQLSGMLPADVGLCPHLNLLDFSDNMFSGALPQSLGKLVSLTYFNISNNRLSSDIPQWIGNMSSLQYIDFGNNAFAGNLPESLGDLKSLSSLCLSNNKLTGEVPLSLAYCTRLSGIQLRGNAFNGSIPQGLFNLGLEELDLSSNGFSGSIPAGSTPLFESLQVMDLSQNKLTGDIPAEMGLFSNLRYLNLSQNNLQSRIPPELGYFQSLSVLDLHKNALYGSIPGDLCDSNSLAILQLDENSLEGPIPQEIGNCSSLYILSLSNNSLSGSIPESLSKLKKLEILALNFNDLSGEIPQELGMLDNLLHVNVSYNRLIGRLPMGRIFQQLDQSALQGNLGICSPLLKGPCKMNAQKPLVIDPNAYHKQRGGNNLTPKSSDSEKLRHRRFLSVSAIIAILATLLIAAGVVIVSLLNVAARRRLAFVNNTAESMGSSSQKSGSAATGKLVLFDSKSSEDWVHNAETVLNKASEIGRGVFGTLYKASIGGEGRFVAIKKLVTSNILQYSEDFEREVRILGRARHPNLMSLKGYYWTPQLQLLISDYTLYGSLQSRLHDRLPSTPPLSWDNRFKIALGTAKGLAHLHHSFRPPIIHYNMKPSNILLDEHSNPMISDFGLARLLTKLDKHMISSRFQSALGYVAPELACQSLRINEKCDVYGYGVMVLELVTGKQPVEYGDDDVLILSDHVRVLLEEGNVLDCIDPSMREYPEEEVLPILKLGLVCTSQIPSSRPSMAEVVQILQVIKTPIPQNTEIF